MTHVKHLLIACALFVVVGIVVFAGQTPAPQTPAPTADPYANNAAPGATQFPLAAPAGKDSGARRPRRPAPSIRGRSIRRRGNTAPPSIRRRARRSGIR